MNKPPQRPYGHTDNNELNRIFRKCIPKNIDHYMPLNEREFRSELEEAGYDVSTLIIDSRPNYRYAINVVKDGWVCWTGNLPLA